MHCASCLFEPAAWTDTDLVRTLDVFPSWWKDLSAGAPAEPLAPYAEVMASLPRRVPDADAVHRAGTPWPRPAGCATRSAPARRPTPALSCR